MSNIQAKDGTDALVPLATHLIGGEHHGAYLPSDPGTGAPFKAADDATVVDVRTAIGAQADAAATTDTGAFSLVAFIKRALQNWTTLLARTPVLGQAAMSASSPVVLASDQTAIPMVRSPATASGNITTQNLAPNGVATAGSAVEIVLAGASSLAIQTTGAYTGALSVQVTLDGARWETLTGAVITNMLSGVAAATIASAAVGVFTVPVHGALRARVTGLAAMTGTAALTLRALAVPTVLYVVQPTAANLNVTASGTVTANQGTMAALPASTNRIGFAAGAGIWYDDTSTALGAAATFSGTSRDATLTGTATAFANAATYAAEIVLSAEQDVTFTLALEVSRDNTAWRRVKAVPSAAVTGGGQYAEIVHRPSWRYWRLVVVNGAGAAARTTAGSIAKAI